MNGDSDIRFQSGEIAWEVADDGVLPAIKVIDAADRKLREIIPLQRQPALRVIASLVDDKDGNRLVRFYGGDGKWSYHRYEVRCTPLGEVTRIDAEEIPTCIAAGTKVSTPHGAIPVEAVREGMKLWGSIWKDGSGYPWR
jgi:hypothetical protein